ncbi:V-type ATPase, V0 complex, 116kDa subunit family [Fimicolochytrium jonesii]|uniref:V-type ATPase, V0 complex, 116kDa subunit family n=1 Tax=Fimicolochytrium jonesii TaxID=1396493 RepID=UPI0022FE2370|nr:V-type ATPase, V0 complex, 116kDa subunit family [Fimicolochytrium jonesii]KAI8819827.1 V-type ATPase, V0 complex, 116kDa subunit family [Fimicolochytrium jonesii]
MSGAGNLFRSEEMSLIKLYIPLEIAQPTVSELGELGQIQFRDLNPNVNAFQRAFVNEIRRLDEMERKLRFLEGQIRKAEVISRPLDSSMYYGRSRTQQEIDELEERLNEHEGRVQQMNTSLETLNKRYLELTELRHVLRETAMFFDEATSRTDDILGNAHREDTELLSPAGVMENADDGEAAERGEGALRSANLGFVAGVISRGRMGTFERILFRALRGNLYMNYAEIDEPITDPITDEIVQKNVFIIFAHGKQLLAKIKKICESMGATVYPVDERSEKRRDDAQEVLGRLEDLKHVLDNTRNQRRIELVKVAENLESWSTVVKKEKAIYHTMNQFNYDQNRKALIAEGWCPTLSLNAVHYALRGVTERTGSTIPPILDELRTRLDPPTFHRTNKFTNAFQEIIDAYGVAAYREVNPGLFTVTTFPFLFAVMFGDFGHGILVTAFAAWMVAKERELEKKKWGEIWAMFFGGRYMILLMGIFSIYTGLIYNDIFSKAMTLFSSGWEFEHNVHTGKWHGVKRWTYPIGVDPAWHGSENSLLFTNSYKMKMAIIFGVLHMSTAICLNVCNYVHFNNRSSIYLEFIPQLTFLLSIFGYLVILIIYKWATVWPGGDAPGLLNTLIYMFLSPGSVSERDKLFNGQAGLQSFLLLVAFVCVPVMLFGKPYYLKKEHEKRGGLGYAGLLEDHGADPNAAGFAAGPGDTRPSEDNSGSSSGHTEMSAEGHGHGHGEEFDFSEVMIHQGIHTIEFCLGAISNTASYLRLWALSLAHAQLSEVLWTMILGNAFKMKGGMLPIALFIGFAFWFSLTVAILIIMEGLSAFLHALRLHWVEFNNKFYAGTGKKFMPFAFKTILEDTEE